MKLCRKWGLGSQHRSFFYLSIFNGQFLSLSNVRLLLGSQKKKRNFDVWSSEGLLVKLRLNIFALRLSRNYDYA